MNYIEILVRLNKLKKILFFILLIFMACGYLLQKNIEKKYLFYVDIYFPSGSFISFTEKDKIYQNFKISTLTELTKMNYNIKQKAELTNVFRISTMIIGNNTDDFQEKKNEITNLFTRQKKNLLLWINSNSSYTNIALNELEGSDEAASAKIKAKLEIMWMDVEKEYVKQNISVLNNLKFPKELALRNTFNYYAVMLILFVTFLTLLSSYFIITDDIKKKIGRLKKTK